MARMKLIYDDPDAFQVAMSIEAFPGRVLATNPVRRAISAEMTEGQVERALSGRLPEGVRIAPEVQYELENADFPIFDPESGVEAPKEGDMDLVLDMINARDAWTRTRGEGVVLAIVDTGVNGARREIAASRRLGGVGRPNPWTDTNGHGTMCASIAAASRDDGGVIDGVAPRATVQPCRTQFSEIELSGIYDSLTGLRATGLTVVASNSFGMRTGQAPVPRPDNLFIEAMNDAVAAGVHVFFSAGNYHEDAGGDPADCSPTSIWLHKGRADVFTVATCDQDRQMWSYSSRGPGQFPGQPGMRDKPDVTAMTPRNGEIVYGDRLRVLPIGWGTSGACPQAAGLAALMLSLDPTLTSSTLFDYIRTTASNLGYASSCQGAGLIDCRAAVQRI